MNEAISNSNGFFFLDEFMQNSSGTNLERNQRKPKNQRMYFISDIYVDELWKILVNAQQRYLSGDNASSLCVSVKSVSEILLKSGIPAFGFWQNESQNTDEQILFNYCADLNPHFNAD